MIEIKNIVEKWRIQDKEGEIAKSEKEAKKLVSSRFHKYIYIFRKKASERMIIKKIQDYTIDVKKEFVLRKRKVYPLSREERGVLWNTLDINNFILFYFIFSDFTFLFFNFFFLWR